MGITLPSWVKDIFDPIAKTIDELHTSKQEKDEALLKLFSAKTVVVGNVLDYETKLVQQQANIVIAEAHGHSWMQRNWRPVLMLSFGFAVVYNICLQPLMQWMLLVISPETTPMPILEIPGWIGALMTAGVSGYVVGRSGEKIAATLTANNVLNTGKKPK